MVNGSDTETRIQEANRLYAAHRYKEALAKYKTLIDEGHLECALRVGWMFRKGLGTSANNDEAMKWYRMAAEAGDPVGKFDLANLYGVRGENIQAIEWYQQAADQGYSPAFYRLGLHYKLAKGLPRDDEKALQMFREAAARGHVFAQRELNKSLLRGSEGVWGRLKGVWRYLVLPMTAAMMGLKDEFDERTRE